MSVPCQIPPCPFFPKRNRKAAFPVKSSMITGFSSLLLPPWAEERVTDIRFYFVVLIDIFYYGHTFGVRVDGTSSRRFLRFLRFLSLTAFQAEGGGGGFAAGCVEGLCSLRSGGDSPSGRGGRPSGDEFYKPPAAVTSA